MEMLPNPKWEIEKEKFLERLGISEREFRKKLCIPDLKRVETIVPLRYMRQIDAISPLSFEMLKCLLSRMKTLGGVPAFENADFQLCKIDPQHLKIGQRFVYRENYQNLLESLPALLGKFVLSSGIGDLGSYFIFGEDMRGIQALACYMPPIIEQHGSDFVVMDGIHRNYIAKQLGKTLSSIVVANPSVPFPCSPKSWSEIKVISLSEKPKSVSERYFDLTKELFRDLKYLGIDG